MGIVRNFIDIIGITPESELPGVNRGEIIEYSDHETIFIPEQRIKIESIYQIMIDLELKSERLINAPQGKIYVLDGVKKLKIIYTDKDGEGKAKILNLERPFNTFMDLPQGAWIENIKLFIADAYFQLLDERNIYSYCLYMIDARYNDGGRGKKGAYIRSFSKDVPKDSEFFEFEIKGDGIDKGDYKYSIADEVSLAKEYGKNTKADMITGCDMSLDSEFL
ncbi:hypothetical protein [Lutispora saccharofermentans]|uniref:Uncharacterized protein n=1 Tax=Lutispora saccharofermentans TaxID=3024236 RepID=A0ABT1NI25_9FIRM|nr:hypothetical protein [Lutispora saccharofermentans]MCQ1530739.1 hypothetical protein [Lutispora saccharofermentans]